MKKTKKTKEPDGRNHKALSLAEINRITHDFWRSGGLPLLDGPRDPKAEGQDMEEEEEREGPEEERRWDKDAGDDEPGEIP